MIREMPFLKSLVLSALFLAFGSWNPAQAQQTVTGTVTDARSGEKLPGVNILVKGTTTGASTGADGKFELTVPSLQDTLVVSYIGYQTKDVAIGGQTELDIQLTPEAIMGEEMVVIGYGEAKKKDLTGSVSSIDLENSPITEVPNVNALQSIKGKVAGLNVGAVTSAGGQPSFSVRGQNSITAGNSPLLVVDGVIYQGSFSDLNPANIASVDILKDASAAAVYGSRAANGVIIISTKSGQADTPKISINSSYGLQDWTNKPDMMNGEESIQYRKDVFRLGGATGSDLDLQNLLYQKEYEAYQDGNSIDWFDEVTRRASISKTDINISGAINKVNYFLSGSLLEQTGIVKGDDYNKKSVRLKLDSDLTDWLKIGTNLSMNLRDYSGNSANMYTATYMPPYGYKYVKEPGFEDWLERYPSSSTTWSNPLRGLDNYNLNKRYNYNGIGFAEIEFPWIEGLEYRFNFSVHRSQSEQAGFTDEKFYVNTLKIEELNNPGQYLNQANGYKNNSTQDSWLINNIISYNRTFFDKHDVGVTLMSERQKSVSEYGNLSARDFEEIGSTALGVHSLEKADNENQSVNTGYSQLTQLAYLFRVNYNYDSKYHGTFSIRRDGYSGFAKGNKFGNFKAFGLGWTLSEESFIKDNFEFVNNLKLRFSYGENGNPSIGSYGTLPTIGNSKYIFGQETVNTAYQSSLSNKDLQWEQTAAYNLGVDFSVLNDRIGGTVEMYRSKTTNLLLTRRLPIMTGYRNILANIGEVNNKGLEIDLNTVNIQAGDFSWESGIVFWQNRNEIVHLYGKDADGDGKEDDDVGNGWFIGESIGAIYDYTFDGIVQKGDVDYQEQYNARPGDVKFKDLNGDGKIDPADRSIIGNTKPNFTLNVSNTVKYKNFDLYFNFNYVDDGNNRYLASNPKGLKGSLVPTNSNWLDLPYWMPDRQSNKYPRPDYNNIYNYGFYQSHSFIRLQDLTLGYTFPVETLEKFNLTKLRLYLSGKNLLTFSDWIGLDPESATPVGAYTLPGLRMFTFGINITL